MFKYLLAVILSAYAAQANGGAYFGMDISPIIAEQQNTMRMLIRTYSEKLAPSNVEVAASSDATTMDSCFNYYFNQEQAISAEYNTQFNGCIATAENSKQSLSTFSAGQRTEIVSRGEAVCSQLSKCESLTDGVEFFECYSSASNDNIQALYGISSDSDTEASNLKIQYAKIENDQNNCTKTAYNTYLNDMSKTNNELQTCLRGGGGPPTTAAPEGEPEEKSTEGDLGANTTEAEPEDLNPEPLPEEDIRFVPQKTHNNVRRILRSRLH